MSHHRFCIDNRGNVIENIEYDDSRLAIKHSYYDNNNNIIYETSFNNYYSDLNGKSAEITAYSYINVQTGETIQLMDPHDIDNQDGLKLIVPLQDYLNSR